MKGLQIASWAVLGLVVAVGSAAAAESREPVLTKMDEAKYRDWLARWEKSITDTARNRYCDREMGEELGWYMSPTMEGFCYGYLATKDPKWIERLIDWTDFWSKRGVKEPDGHVGWPKPKAAGTVVDQLDDSAWPSRSTRSGTSGAHGGPPATAA
jgi:hypothetical protein